MDKCYLCGSTENLTRDHVPPEGFFPPPKPTNLITLPCCENCHWPLSLQDEAFRLWVASVANASDAGLWILRNRVIGSSFKRSPKLFANVRKFAAMRQLRLPGKTVTVPTLAIPQGRAKIVLIRITKGLLTYFHPDYDLSRDEFKVFCPSPVPKNQATIFSLMQACKHDSRGNGVFDFWHNITMDKMGGATRWAGPGFTSSIKLHAV